MFAFIRDLARALQAVATQLRIISDLLPEILEARSIMEPLEERVSELERARHQWEAQVEAELLRSDSKFKAARAAEERQRKMTADAEALSSGDEGEDEVREQYLELLRANGGGSAPVAVQAVPESVAVNPKTRVLQAKFGVRNG